MDDQRSFLLGFLTGKRQAQRRPDKPFVRKRPKMPSRPWRIAALTCFVAGAALAWAVSRNAPGATVVLRTVLGGLFGLAVGMYIVEALWERYVHRRAPVTDRQATLNRK
jgi:hypothetical protein